ncbi:cell division protein FtsL [Pasteurellaceae bacterium HPA106]|uniref:cell division protein FtsL n=1 Tax=Spirabiliibacterium pneumoniae TaxID=221400 RepID=UPI001AAC8A4D|nr:cell division protein FtsL [Spirabiliibacterium pneumoniae]MBE2896699.1 cell division protein FtsL [Spirabiliibacterium pneumoniae]
MNVSDRHPLRKIIIDDLLAANKIALVLLLVVILSAVATIYMIHQTRQLNAHNGELILEKRALENDYVNLKLEEHALDDNVRITGVARRMHMGEIANEQQVIIIEPGH